jgi:hypothetical protein
MNNLTNLESQNKPLFFQHKNNYIKLTFPEKGKVRMRKVSTRSRARPTGEYPSWKMSRMMEWESHNELNAFVLLDASPSIQAFAEQPMLIEYSINGVAAKHYPDIVVAKDGELQVWEIKPAKEANKEDVRIRTGFLTEYLPKIGYSYHVVTGEQLSNKLLLDNARTILKFGRAPIDSTSREIMRVYFLSNDSINWLDDLYTNPGVDIRCILSRLTLEGLLAFDSSDEISEGTVFRLLSNVSQ